MSQVIVIAGPTGSGKSHVALELAGRSGGEIVNYDSIQIYRGFDIGSAKPSPAERARVPHHLFDIVDAPDDYTAADYQRDADRVTSEIFERNRVPVFVGGTFFYLRAFLSGLPEMPPKEPRLRERLDRLAQRPRGFAKLRSLLGRVDPVSASRIAAGDWHRTQRALEVYFRSGRPISAWERPTATSRRVAGRIFALAIPRAELVARLDKRTEAMYGAGLVDETRALLSLYSSAARPFESIGYREAVRYLLGECTIDAAIAETKRRTRAYAKRQMTWLRGERDVQWLDGTQPPRAIAEQIELKLRSGDRV